MRRLPLWLRATVRVAAALALSLLGGVLVWVVGQVFFPVPLLFPVLLGVLAGAAAVLPTLGLVVAGRRPRVVLALGCAAAATAAVQCLDYARFVSLQRRAQIALDYRTSAAEADDRVRAVLIERTGHGGPRGYVLATLAEGVPVAGGLRLRGLVLAGYRLAELGICALVAARWSAGPRPAARGSGVS